MKKKNVLYTKWFWRYIMLIICSIPEFMFKKLETLSTIAFFDFDGTITRKDTLFEIIRYQKGPLALYAGMLLLSRCWCCSS